LISGKEEELGVDTEAIQKHRKAEENPEKPPLPKNPPQEAFAAPTFP